MSVNRPVDRRQNNNPLSCTKVHLCTSIDRAVDRLQELCSRLGLVDRPGLPSKNLALWFGTTVDRPVDRSPQRSKIRLLSVDRPVDRQKTFLLYFIPTAIFYFVFFWGLFPTILLGFLLMFSSHINSGTVGKLNNKISKV